MGDVMMLIMGLIVGFLCTVPFLKDVYHTGYQDGLRDSAKEAQEETKED